MKFTSGPDLSYESYPVLQFWTNMDLKYDTDINKLWQLPQDLYAVAVNDHPTLHPTVLGHL